MANIIYTGGGSGATILVDGVRLTEDMALETVTVDGKTYYKEV